MNHDRALVDTNVFADATDVRRQGHETAVALLERHTSLVLCAQVAREYLVIATRPTGVNGLGLTTEEAMANLGEFRRAARLLPEEKPLLPALLGLLRDVPCQGRLIHDAQLVATMLAHGVQRLITSNAADFSRFADRISILAPADALR
jgi:predicted nucleic acid-binding protein